MKNLPIDFLKIDGSFVRDLPNQQFNQAALRAIRIIADALDIGIVAEFVETVEEYELLQKIGISHAQGHFIAIPRRAPYAFEEIDIFRQSPAGLPVA